MRGMRKAALMFTTLVFVAGAAQSQTHQNWQQNKTERRIHGEININKRYI